MRHVVAALVSSMLALSSAAKDQPVVSISSEPTGLTVHSKTGEKIVPGIDIYSDGLVLIRRYDGSEARKHLERSRMDRLLKSLARTRFYEVTEDSFDAELPVKTRTEKDGTIVTSSRIFITDCPIWTMQTRYGSVARSTKFYGLCDLAEHYPKSKELKRLKSAFLLVYSSVGEMPF